jgi:hypothetical protein
MKYCNSYPLQLRVNGTYNALEESRKIFRSTLWTFLLTQSTSQNNDKNIQELNLETGKHLFYFNKDLQ